MKIPGNGIENDGEIRRWALWTCLWSLDAGGGGEGVVTVHGARVPRIRASGAQACGARVPGIVLAFLSS